MSEGVKDLIDAVASVNWFRVRPMPDNRVQPKSYPFGNIGVLFSRRTTNRNLFRGFGNIAF
jgi:hypothetical protein